MSSSQPPSDHKSISNLQYTLLEHPRSIRVLILEGGSYEEDIVCYLRHANLDEKPLYCASSYVWGETVPINCSITVRANLARALRRVREPSNSGTLWVDALCINQTDVDERNVQVRMMNDIYRQAGLVVAYIGEDTEGTPIAFELLGLFIGASLYRRRSRADVVEVLHLLYWRGNAEWGIPLCYSPKWDALQNFFRREYFSRIWVLQEVALAKADPVVLWGERRLCWQAIASAARL
jgi:Heterokaryon incompatibility protein (HET)